MSFKTASFTSVGNRGLNPTISLASTRRVANPVWNFTLPATFQGTVAGYMSGGNQIPSTPPILTYNIIDKFPFATNANATDVGNLTLGGPHSGGAGQSSDVSGYTSGGYVNGLNSINTIDKFPFASNGNATDVGDLTTIRAGAAGQSSSVNGYTSGGYSPIPGGTPTYNIIDKFPFASNANATDVGDLNIAHDDSAGASSAENGYCISRFPGATGTSPTGTNLGPASPPAPFVFTKVAIDKFPFATDANATDIGELSHVRYAAVGQSSDVSGYLSGGYSPSPSAGPKNIIDKFPFAADSGATATDVGDLTVARREGAGQSSTASGYTSGGYATFGNGTVNVIDKFPFASDANATDVGDLSTTRYNGAGQQD